MCGLILCELMVCEDLAVDTKLDSNLDDFTDRDDTQVSRCKGKEEQMLATLS
jgi:hypothetical protein